MLGAGEQGIRFDTRSGHASLPAGSYYYRLEFAGEILTGRMAVLR
jgi:hypothetical protein